MIRANSLRAGVCTAIVLALAGCATTSQKAAAGFNPPSGSYRLIVIQPDVSVGVKTAGGAIEPREDWTAQARAHLIDALSSQQAARGGKTTIASTAADVDADPQMVLDLVRLHNLVGQAVLLHKYQNASLPTKQDVFDWTLGEAAVEMGRATGHDYALFLRVDDSFSSAGRFAMEVASIVVCGASSICLQGQGGQQIAFASLVDLQSGHIVWFNFLHSTVGDVRTEAGARRMVRLLLDKMKPGEA